MKMNSARSLNVRERVTMVAIVGTMAAFAVGGSLAYQARGGGGKTDDLLVPLPPASAPRSLTVPAGGGGESGDHVGTATVSEELAEAAPVLPLPNARTAATPTAARETIIVYVTGAVKKPGIVTMRAGDRIFQAVHQAGGFKAGAVKDALNLADRLQDGDQVHVPARGDAAAQTMAQTAARPTAVASLAAPVRHAEAPPILSSRGGSFSGSSADRFGSVAPPRPARVLGRPPAAVAAPVTSSAAGLLSDPNGAPKPAGSRAGGSDNKLRNPGDGTVNINTAGSAELQRLVRCGPAMAERILAYRQQIKGGRFTSPQQLMDVKGVGEKTFAKWEPFVTVK